MKRAHHFIIMVFSLLSVTSQAGIRLPKILSNNMVIQRNKPITLWGWADANEKVTILFKQQSKSVKADASGKWLVTLSPEAAGGPFTMTFKGKNTITLTDILVGEVWVCSGQSNMEWPLAQTKDAATEIRNANYPQIRQFLVQKAVSLKKEEDVKAGEWKLCSPETAPEFTAVGYFFARELYNQLNIPVGLINTTWGGTHSETWTSQEAFENSVEFKSMIATMPKVSMEELAKARKEAIAAKLKTMNLVVPAGGVAEWKDAAFNDSKWNTMNLPALWESQLGELDGTIWFRKSVTVMPANAGKEATLYLSMIDDSDDTYVNGVKVGTTVSKYSEKRIYKVPAGVLKEGANTIAVRVDDTGGGGGIYGDPRDMKLTTSSGAVIPLAGNWYYNLEKLSEGASSIGPNTYPTLLFNAMLNPITHFAIEGVIWYQGESNAGRAYQYRTAFPLMIQDWRNQWKLGDFPFYFVQLASFNAANGTSEHGSSWGELREAQTMTLSLPNTGMAVTTDIGEANDIHPRNKQDVGKRLAAIALNKVYSKGNVYSGPMYQSIKIEANKIRISFTQTGSGLMVKDKYGYLKGFEIAGADQKFYYAKAWLEGMDVVVAADGVPTPVAVRYAWADNPEDANLYNKEGFPASPFRSDTWKGITAQSKFTIE